MLPNQSFIPYGTSVQDGKTSTRFPYSVPDTRLVNLQMYLHSAVLDLSTRKCWYESYISGELCRCKSMYHFPICNFTLCCSLYWFGNKNHGFAQFQFHVLPGLPNMIISSASPGWPLWALALWLHQVCGNAQLRWQFELSIAWLWTCFIEVGIILLYNFFFQF